MLILGGSGFIGTKLTSLLTELDIPVWLGDIRPSQAFPDLWTHCDVRRHGLWIPAQARFTPPYFLSQGLARTIRFEFPE